VAGLPALRVWAALMRSSKSPDETIVEEWLQQAREAHDMLLGDGHFQHQHGKFIKEIKAESHV